jgi:epoxyqueuosine reductase
MPDFNPESTPKSPRWWQIEILQVIRQQQAELGLEDWWREPLVGVAAADDPMFLQLKQAVDPEHAMPSDLLAGARSVIVYFLPFRRSLAKENARHGFFAARSWATAYVVTNRLIATINNRLQERMAEAGHQLCTTPATHNFDQQKLISLWSHKHLAYIAGLGTFGHHHLIITAAGCCGRLGSVVTDCVVQPTSRPDQEWCLAKAGKPCHVCVDHCRYDALHRSHFDRHACYTHLLRNDDHYPDLPTVDVCGKCACQVPCSHGIPNRQAPVLHQLLPIKD